ncbi:MAG: hypothetical protein M1817_004332 [Caeruleum heppii]|nr:MAG: hypothetical protein M1817_004332 [Caeruleum heppii]
MDVQRTNKLRLQEGKIACREMYSLPSTDACDAGSTLGPNRRSMTPIHGLAMFDWILSYLKVRAFVSPWDAEFLFESLLTDGEKQQAEGILNVLKNARSADMAQHLCTLLDGTAFEELIMAYAGIKTWALRLADDLDERSEIDSMGACDVLAAMILHLQALEDSILQDTLTLDDIEANMMRMFAAGMFYMPQGPEDVDFDLIADGDVAAMLSALRSKLVMRLGSTSDQDNATLLRTAGHHLTEVGRLAKYLEALRMTSV